MPKNLGTKMVIYNSMIIAAVISHYGTSPNRHSTFWEEFWDFSLQMPTYLPWSASTVVLISIGMLIWGFWRDD